MEQAVETENRKKDILVQTTALLYGIAMVVGWVRIMCTS